MLTKCRNIIFLILTITLSPAFGQPGAYVLSGKIVIELQKSIPSKTEIVCYIDTFNNISKIKEIDFNSFQKLSLDSSGRLNIALLGGYFNIDPTIPNCNIYIRIVTNAKQKYYFKLTGSLARQYTLNYLPNKPGKYLLTYDKTKNECGYQKVCHTLIPLKFKF